MKNACDCPTSGALEIVVRVLKQEKYSANIEVCSSVLMAAANLACNTQGQELFAQLGACEAIMAMMRSGKCRTHCGVQENGLLAMGNLAVVDSGQSILLKHDAVGLVMSTLRNERFREALRVHNQGLGVLYVRTWTWTCFSLNTYMRPFFLFRYAELALADRGL